MGFHGIRIDQVEKMESSNSLGKTGTGGRSAAKILMRKVVPRDGEKIGGKDAWLVQERIPTSPKKIARGAI